MKKLWLHSVRAYIKLGLFFYFKNIKVFNAESIPKNKPVLFLSNHQNALLDALLIGTNSGRFSYFLTRASVFKKSFVSHLLKSLNMLPMYRIRDGWSELINNNPVFNECTNLLHHNEAVVIFPEGSHHLNRTVRPLSKGFTRIIFDTLATYPNIDLQLVPVGVNFVNAETFADSAALYFGHPIDANTYLLEDRNQGVINLKEAVFKTICGLTTHIDNEGYDESLQKLENLNVDFLNPKAVNQCIASNFKDCESSRKPRFSTLKQILKRLLILNLIFPYAIWKLLLQPKVKEIEFRSTFRFAVAITLVPLYLVLLVLGFTVLFSLNFALFYLISVLLLSLLTVKL